MEPEREVVQPSLSYLRHTCGIHVLPSTTFRSGCRRVHLPFLIPRRQLLVDFRPFITLYESSRTGDELDYPTYWRPSGATHAPMSDSELGRKVTGGREYDGIPQKQDIPLTVT
jgi:hypothetical protein